MAAIMYLTDVKKVEVKKSFRNFVRRTCLAIFTVFSWLVLVSCGDRVDIREQVTLVSIIQGESQLGMNSLQADPTAGKVAYLSMSPEGFQACMNFECTQHVERVEWGAPVISLNAEHWACVVKKGENRHPVLNGRIGLGYDLLHALRFSPDSMKLVYIAEKDGESFVYVNQRRMRPFSAIDPRQGIVFSNDSEHLAYVANEGKGKWRVVVDENPGPAFDGIKHVSFPPEAGYPVYAARENDLWHLVTENDKGPGYRDIQSVAFCPSSGRIAYVAKTDEGEAVIVDGEMFSVFDRIFGAPVFSVDGHHLAYRAFDYDRMRMVVNVMGQGEMIHQTYQAIGMPVFDPENARLAYRVHERTAPAGSAAEALAGTLSSRGGGKHNENPGLNPGGSWFVRVDGERAPAFEWVKDPVFSADGKRMAYVALKNGRYWVVADERRVGTYQWAGKPVFSPDGKHLAYVAQRGRETFLVVDGREGKERFSSFLRDSDLVFINDNTVQGIAVRDDRRQFYRLRAEISFVRKLGTVRR